ncbi:hypothetical protein Poli38472_002687 [Pythium oligandrum]|uniref:U3 small nucleolar RNA-associated protein 6 n=1 Tax=Pythium oligandrum TaxID=41045 RepID=A0A8K1CJ92_PYTOL|nr:hypothetical protein Poli38472_002687 [Pythium oligandrum]|eukprot:TMW63746.1 hypothetical protein Poli38472_002687 [Pythium oligandrum]
MADTVQVMMEKMIPELEDLQEKKLFNADEIHQIVEKRREFEYMMKRVPLRKLDGLRYIEYELNLEALRKKRKDRLGLQKMSISDTAGIRRVHSIFDRVLFKHRGSIDLWLQYIEFCKTENSGRVLSHVFTRALQSHPRSPELWIEAASFEFSVNLSVDSARVLMQRAIRINKHEPKLWHEYFRLELLYIQKLSVRREILKLDEDSEGQKQDTGASVLLEELPEEQNGEDDDAADAVQTETEKQRTRALILDGAIPRIVYKNAISSIPDDVAFRLGFIEISDLFGRRFASNLSQFIVDACLEDFPTSELVHAVQALRPFTTEDDLAHAERLSVERFEKSVAELKTVTMKEKFVEWIIERLASPDKTEFLVEYTQKALPAYVKSDGASSTEICVKYVDFVHRVEGTTRAIALLHEILEKQNPRSAQLWLLLSQLVLHAPETADNTRATKRRRTSTDRHTKKHDKAPIEDAVALLRDGLARLASNDFDGLYTVWERLLQLLVSDAATSVSTIEEAFQSAMKSQVLGSDAWNALREQYLVWSAAVRPLPRVRALYKKFLSDTQLLPSQATYSFLLRCVDIETSVLSSEISIDQVRMLFEKLVDLFGSAQEDVWVTYIQFYKDQARFTEANHVLHRATRLWKDSPRLLQLAA